MTIERGPINGLPGPHIIFEGANVHIRSGAGRTVTSGTPNGLGNLIIGYNELPAGAGDRGQPGEHNVVIGKEHRYPSFGGFVAGQNNGIFEVGASVTGGSGNSVTAAWASIGGGRENVADGNFSHVSGGFKNRALGNWSSVSGGQENSAGGDISSVSGGS